MLIVCTGYYAYNYTKNAVIKYFQLKEEQSIDTWHTLMFTKIESMRTDLMITALLTDIRSTLNGEPGALENLTEEFLTISKSKGIYGQIRLLDRNGMELVRVDRIDQKSFVVPQNKLQNKGQRYYFNDTFSLQPGSIYISPLDLNFERGAIEIPYKPMLRLATAVYDDEAVPIGVVVLNYLAEDLLKKFRQAKFENSIKFMTNNDGYWLIGPTPEAEWGFMFEKRQSENIETKWPDEWKIIRYGGKGQFISDNGIYTYATLSPLQNGDISSSGAMLADGNSNTKGITSKEYFWKIFSHVPKKSLLIEHRKQRNAIISFGSLFYGMAVFLIFAKAKARRAEADMNRSREEAHKILEQEVYERTDALFKTNRKLEREIKERKKSEQIIAENEEKIRLLFTSTAEGIYGLDTTGNCTFCNQSCIKQLGYTSESDLMGQNMHDLIHKLDITGTSHSESQCLVRQSFDKGLPAHSDIEVLWRADGSNFIAECWTHPIIKDDRIIGAVVSFLDITKRRELESQVIQAQKMEAIGTLAGGIAHDLNNILSPIIGYTEMVKEVCENDAQITEDLDEVLIAASRGTDLVRQILAISREKSGKRILLAVAPVTKEALKLITVGIPPHITLQTDIGKDLPNILMETTQFHQIIMNLCTNAIHAMEQGGGHLHVRLGEFKHDQASTAVAIQMPPGRYLHLHVSDQGHGIASGQLDKIFDPFYTSKPEGKGTGLGLSVVHGIVKANDGYIDVHSEPEEGTAFDLYFPEADPKEADEDNKEASPSLAHGQENVLLVDDWPSILNLEKKRLQRLGYQVTAVIDPIKALEIFERNPNAFDIVVSDYGMPGLTGMQFAAALRRRRPDLPIILCTGFQEYFNDQSQILDQFNKIIIKPTEECAIAAAMRSVLDDK